MRRLRRKFRISVRLRCLRLRHRRLSGAAPPVVADARGNSMFADFLRRHSCYDLLPISGKVVVLDASLLVKKAFYALQQNGSPSSSRCIPLFCLRY